MVVVAHFALPGAKLCFSTGRESVFVELVEVVFILVSGVNIVSEDPILLLSCSASDS